MTANAGSPASLIRTSIPLATSWGLHQKYSRTSFYESCITSDIALDCCWTLLQAVIAVDWQKTFYTPPPHTPPNVYNICFHLHLLLDTGFVHPFSKHKSFICCRFPFTKLFSLFSGKVEGWLSLWKSRYPIRTDSYPGAFHMSVSMLFVFCFTCMIYAINCTASLLCCKDFY